MTETRPTGDGRRGSRKRMLEAKARRAAEADAAGLMALNQAYRFELRPNREQLRKLAQHAGLAKFAYNWFLRQWTDWWEANRDLPKDERAKRASAADLSSRWTQEKEVICTGEAGDYWAEGLNRWPVQGALAACDMAHRSMWAGRTGRPRFKGRSARRSFAVQHSRVKVERDRINIPGIGVVRTKEPTTKLQGLIRAVSVASPVRGRWWVSLTVERTRAKPAKRVGPAIGVDFGLRNVVTLSTGETFAADSSLEKSLKRLARLQRKMARGVGPDRRTGQKASKRWLALAEKVAALHFHVAEQRRSWLHRVTTILVQRYATLVVEGYDAREIAKVMETRAQRRMRDEAAIGMARWMLVYKGKWHGCEVVIAPKHCPTNTTCRKCLVVSERPQKRKYFVCTSCGHKEVRQLHTARFLASRKWSEEGPGMDSGPKTDVEGNTGVARARARSPRPAPVKRLNACIDSEGPGG